MKQVYMKIASNELIAPDVYRMTLAGDTDAVSAPGQFVNIKLNGFFLRRPISVCDSKPGLLTILYKTVGLGTESMSRMRIGEVLDVLVGLGNGYDLAPSGDRPLLIGGGVGVPPLYLLCKQLIRQNKTPVVILGFNEAKEVFYEKEFSLLCKTLVTTVDSSYGIRGFATDALNQAGDYTYFYTCGPEPMLKAVYTATVTSGQFSFEERMGCGFGACMGCSCKTKYGNKRICKDGPVLVKEEIIW